MTDASDRAGAWWDWHLFGLWVLVNCAGYAVVVLGGTALEFLASSATKGLVEDHRPIAVLLVAVIGAAFHGTVVGRWQWQLLRRRVPDLRRRRWVIATLTPAFLVWLLVIAPEAVDVLAKGGDTLGAFRNGFAQALVLGPLIGAAQATALRDDSSRWMWWFVANVTAYLSGAALHELGVWLSHELALPGRAVPYFPLVAFTVHGAWMLWVTAPAAARRAAKAPEPPPG